VTATSEDEAAVAAIVEMLLCDDVEQRLKRVLADSLGTKRSVLYDLWKAVDVIRRNWRNVP
jgi:hypothetical protein